MKRISGSYEFPLLSIDYFDHQLRKASTMQKSQQSLIPQIQKITVAVDGSENSFRACELAGIIAKGVDAQVTTVSVLPSISIFSAPMKQDYYSDQEKGARESIEKAASLLMANSGIKAGSEILRSRGSVSDSLIKHITRERSDLVVAGTRGLGGFKRMLIGSVSSHLVSHSPSPVLVVRDPETKKIKLKRIIVATDGSESSSRAERLAISLGKSLDLKLTFVSVVYLPPTSYAVGGGVAIDKTLIALREDATKAASKAASLAKSNGVQAETKVIDEFRSPVASITNLAKKEEYDLVVVGTRGLGGFKKLALGSVAEGILHYAICSVLIAK